MTESVSESSAEAVVVSREGGLGFVTLNRPIARNALRVRDKRAIGEAIDDLVAGGVRVIIVTGSGDRAFCAGTDIKEMATFSATEGLAMLQTEAEMFDKVMRAPVPVVAAVNGAALGAGCVLAYCCDLVIAGKSATFGQPEVRNGVPAPVQAALLPRIVGLNRARWMIYTGEVMSAQNAYLAGLVGLLADDVTLLLETRRLADKLAIMPIQGMSLQKRIVDSWVRDSFDASVSSSAYIAAFAFETGEPQEAIRKFLARSR